MCKFNVSYDPDELKELWKKTPYNYKKDVKDISEDELKRIAEDVGNEIYNGLNRPPVANALYFGINRKAAYAKIRVIDTEHGFGKSSAYRCVVLVDYVNNHAYLLHIYRHGKGKDDNIDKKAKNKLRQLVDEYVESL